jgi:uncharacterized membrane protein YphA (DoxX/SURF4 family)
MNRTITLAAWAVRLALAASFLSAVADRFGFWGPPGAAGVAWGNVAQYESYAGKLLWFLPATLAPAFGWAATVAETLIALGLLWGWRLRWFALAAAVLLALFAIAMTAALGVKSPLDYSVFTAVSAAFLLSCISPPTNASAQPM